MAIKTKRLKRRQATVTKAYKHVRKVMLALGLPVAAYAVPTFMPEFMEGYTSETTGKYFLSRLKGQAGVYLRDMHVVMMVRSYSTKEYLDTLCHECVHACQSIENWEDDVDYNNRPHEMEARLVADIAVVLWDIPEHAWGQVIYQKFYGRSRS